ncbi:hypothetical protein HNR23_004848 [Nocardiopsis mwathae]|uniref:Uncharacterized protein n=1 Tax=Nocardiopsis mwathae TaxID=1472723 RepID=A0A7W9YMB2_9ACTN|nr:DUF5957 family protein [Nocardiopsis mwathae]MBB6174788.1 hypothetical protein [Nocardiopsis mwathae]
MQVLRVLGAALLGAVGGFVLGIVVSEAIAISAFMIAGGAEWMRVFRFIPGALALVGLVGAPLLVLRTRRADVSGRSGAPGETPGR